MFNLERSIISAMASSNMAHCFIIFNSEYIMKNRNRVQCVVRKNNDESYLEFFVDHGLTTTLSGSRTVINDGMETLKIKANSNDVFGMELPIDMVENGIMVKPVVALNTIIIESMEILLRNRYRKQPKEKFLVLIKYHYLLSGN